MIGATGIARPALRMAARTRSRLSRTVESGKPTVLTAGLPDKRRTGVPWCARAYPRRIALSISGHTTRSIFDRYNIASGNDQRKAIRAVSA